MSYRFSDLVGESILIDHNGVRTILVVTRVDVRAEERMGMAGPRTATLEGVIRPLRQGEEPQPANPACPRPAAHMPAERDGTWPDPCAAGCSDPAAHAEGGHDV